MSEYRVDQWVKCPHIETRPKDDTFDFPQSFKGAYRIRVSEHIEIMLCPLCAGAVQVTVLQDAIRGNLRELDKLGYPR
jgi:hypothetical protein